MSLGKSTPSPWKTAFVALLTTALFAAPPLSHAVDSAPGPQDQQGLVYQMLDFDWYTHFTGWANASGEESSQDPTKRTQYFFSDTDGGNYQRDMIGASGHTEHVMIDVTGPGMLTRFFLAGPQAQGYIRFYIDGNLVNTTWLDDMMQGRPNAFTYNSLFRYTAGPTTINVGGATPNGQGSAEVPPGLDLYLPIPFANHIVVTYDGPSNRDGSNGFPVLDYIWEYKRFRPGTGVTNWDGKTGNLITFNTKFAPSAFSMSQMQGEGQQQPQLDIQWWYPQDSNDDKQKLADPFSFANADSNHLWYGPGVTEDNKGTLTIPSHSWVVRGYDGNGGSAIRFLQSWTSDMEGLVLSLSFYSNNGNDENAVNQSIGEFFGSGEGLHSGQTQMQAVDKYGDMLMRWVMPFQNYGKIVLSNPTDHTIYVSMLANVSGYGWNNDDSMHFHAVRQINGPMYMYSSDLGSDGKSLTMAHTMRMLLGTGKGLLVGDSESILNYQPSSDTTFNWWGEGDELIYVDNSPMPTHRGTGSEDYFGYAYGHTYLFETPWTSQTSVPRQCYIGSFCYDGDSPTVLNRVRMLDAIPFNNAIRYDFEIHENHDYLNELVVDHTTFFYALPGSFHPFGSGAANLVENGTYTIESKQNGWLLTTHGGDPASTDVPSGLGEQKFTLHSVPGQSGVYNIVTEDQNLTNAYGPQYLTCCRNKGGPQTVFLYNLDGGSNGTCHEQWRISDETENAPDVPNPFNVTGFNHFNNYQTVSNLCGETLDVVNATTNAGTWVQGYADHTGDTYNGFYTGQVWRFNLVPANFFLPASDGTQQGISGPGKNDPIVTTGLYAMRNAHFYNLAVDVPGASTAPGVGVQVYDNNGSAAQQWNVNYMGNGIYTIVDAKSGLALQDNGYGNQITQEAIATNQTNQQWAFIQQWDLSVYFIKNIASGAYLTMGSNPYNSNQYSAGARIVTLNMNDPAAAWQTWSFQPIPY